MLKLDVAVEMPDILDLSALRGCGLQSDEELLPESPSGVPVPVYNQEIWNEIMDMGFPPEACKKALYFTENRGFEAAKIWLIEHVADSDFADPFIPPGANSGATSGKIKYKMKTMNKYTNS